MLCIKVILINLHRNLIIFQITLNLLKEFDVIMAHMNIVLRQCQFLKFFIILSFGESEILHRL